MVCIKKKKRKRELQTPKKLQNIEQGRSHVLFPWW